MNGAGSIQDRPTLTHMYVDADIINEAQQLCMAVTQHSCRRQAGQLCAQCHQLLLCCCHEGGPGCGGHLHQLLAHSLTETQRACNQQTVPRVLAGVQPANAAAAMNWPGYYDS
jgi:hypothetical protein